MPPDPASTLRHARRPDDPATQAFAGVIAQALRAQRRPLIRGLSESCFQRLLKAHFCGVDLANGQGRSPPSPAQASDDCAELDDFDAFDEFDDFDEFEDIVELLLEHRASPRQQNGWLAYAIASAAMGDQHLWQDLGLPDRQVLSELMRTHFPTLAARNVGDMKWKKFFYRQLCERAGIPICKSPHCADCSDYRSCFGPEDA